MHQCPNCGYEIEPDLECCPQCAFNFNFMLNCPYKLSGKCVHNHQDCFIEGLNYEDCTIYLHKAGISK